MYDGEKVAEFIALLSGNALEWAWAVWEAQDYALVEDCSDSEDEGEQLLSLSHGNPCAAE